MVFLKKVHILSGWSKTHCLRVYEQAPLVLKT